jgi:hypothetical protein
MNNQISSPHSPEGSRRSALEAPFGKVNGFASPALPAAKPRKQRVTITLPVSLLERLRNAVYWTGHGPLARLIADALDDAVTQMETSNGQAFPQRLAPLKRGRPRTKTRSAPLAVAPSLTGRIQ